MVILGISFQLLFHSVNPAISQEIPKGATQASAKLTTQQSPAMDKQVARQYRGSERCDQCHFNPSPRVFTDFVMLTEARQFLERDKHSQAAQLLNGPRAKQIGMLLKLPNVAEDQQCLSCHANWKKGNERPPEWKKGVNCEACHGPSAEWDVPHSAREWRLQTPEAKTQLGLVDVRNSARRAEQCFACHIGSVAEGKVITHAMYAAGHPPLPGIEIESFAEQMPAHWRTLAEKGSFEHRDSYLKVNAPHDPSGKDLPRTKQMIVGGLVALRESLELVADQTRQEPNEWPELAAFDCQACHHELRSPSWRQERHPLSAPGRPTLPEWPFALVNTGLRQIAGPDEKLKQTLVGEFRKHRAALYASIQKQPFGEPMSTRDAIEKFLDWLKPTISKLEATQFDLPAATRARLELLTLEDSEFPDFHSARQIVWACGVIGQELELRKHPLALAEIPLKESDTARRNRENSNTGLLLEWREKTLKPMRQKWAGEWSAENAPFQLPLLLPTGPGKPDSEDVPQELIVNGLSQSLEAVSNYDALKFRARLKQMRETLLSE
ncbi:MAG: hypothetical protein JWM11_7097 [Planctomycetaceae bacterium]|nr:hypothetical protein [Planctomycetaceae bacterium]